MTPLQQALGRLALLHDAVAEADLDRAALVLDELANDLDRVGREHRPHVGDHCCVTCESTCDGVTALKRAVRVLQQENQALAWALVHSRNLVNAAQTEIDRRFPPEVAA